MAKKQKHPEHINLERYLISYADFITLLFATFVVLYALSQVDIKGFQSLENSIQQAFAAPSLMQGSDGVMQESGANSLFDTSQADSMVAPLMMEYMSQKYEDESMQEIEKEINENAKSGENGGIQALETEKGLIIRFNDDFLFTSGSASLTPTAKIKLDKVGVIICKKFILHSMRVEGHTDNQPLSTGTYPSNWELSSARASAVIRYFISRFKFMPNLFSAVGLADTRPLVSNTSPENMAKNRRVEILILKNKFKSQESSDNVITKMSKDVQEKMQNERLDTINRIGSISDAARKLSNSDKKIEVKTIILNNAYDNEVQRLDKQTKALEPAVRAKVTGQGGWLKPPASSGIKVFKDN